jgi:hypothetical protein
MYLDSSLPPLLSFDFARLVLKVDDKRSVANVNRVPPHASKDGDNVKRKTETICTTIFSLYLINKFA